MPDLYHQRKNIKNNNFSYFLAVDNLKCISLCTICILLYICLSKIDLEFSYCKDIIPKISEDIS